MDIQIFDAIGEVSDNGNEQSIAQDQVPFIERPSLIFKAGERYKNHKPWTTADLQEVVANFQEPTEGDWSVPVQVDHSTSANNTTGFVRNVWLRGDQLWGTLRFIGAKAIESVRGGTWKKLSAGLDPSAKRLHHVAVTPFPHVAGAQVFSKEGAPNSMDIAELQKQLEQLKAQQAADLQLFNAELAKRDEQANLQAQIIEQMQENNKIARVAGLVEKFSQAGLIAPAQAEAESKFMLSLGVEQLQQYEAVKMASKPVVEFGQRSIPDGTNPAQDDGKAKEDAQFERMKGIQ